MGISEQEFQVAPLRGEEVRRTGYAVRADYDTRQKRLVVDVNIGVTVMVPVHLIEEPSDATADDLMKIEISPTGLMQGVVTKRLTAAQLSAAGGSAPSPAKAAAVRANGANGGRPKKQA